jgi:hypothetical protein
MTKKLLTLHIIITIIIIIIINIIITTTIFLGFYAGYLHLYSWDKPCL